MSRTNPERIIRRVIAAFLAGACFLCLWGLEPFLGASCARGQIIDDPADVNDPTVIDLAPQTESGTSGLPSAPSISDGIPPVGEGTNVSVITPPARVPAESASPSAVTSGSGALAMDKPETIQNTVPSQTVNTQQEFNGAVQPEPKDSASSCSAPIPLAAPESETSKSADGKPVSTGFSFVKVMGTLIVLIGLLAAWVGLNRLSTGNRNGRTLSSELRVLGHGALLGKAIYFVETGKKILVVAANSNGLETLTEITDPEEINRLNRQMSGANSAGAGTEDTNVPRGKK